MRAPILRVVLPLALVAVLGSCAGQQAEAPPVDTARITATIDSLGQAFVAAFTARDTDAVVSFYADDAHLLPPNEPRAEGRDGVRATMGKFLSMPGLALSIQMGPVLVSQAGDMAVEIGSYKMGMTGPKGRPVEDVGKYVTIYRNTDQGWKIVVDMFNSDKPGPAM